MGNDLEWRKKGDFNLRMGQGNREEGFGQGGQPPPNNSVKSNESIEFAVFRILQEKRKTTGA